MSLESLRADIAKLKRLARELALMTLPPNLRTECGCGALACRTLTCVRGSVPEPKRFPLCSECKLETGWTVVGQVELGPSERQTIDYANSILRETR